MPKQRSTRLDAALCARLSTAASAVPPPCTTLAAASSRRAGFTPQLAAAYEMANEDEKRFEVVFVSSDESAQARRPWDVHGLVGSCVA